MKAYPPARRSLTPLDAAALVDQPNIIQRFLKPLLDLSENSDYLVGGSAGEFAAGNDVFQIPRFIFMGPAGGGDTIRLGIFAGLHGDEAEGTEALVEFLRKLEDSPQLARGYHIYIYPVCNPTGFAARTHGSAGGEDLSAHFWRGSSQPEIYYLEREIGVLRFQGVISLQTANSASNFSLHTSSDILNRALVQPALQTTKRFLPGKAAETGRDNNALQDSPVKPLTNFLTATRELNPLPFELQIAIPGQAPQPSRIHGTVNALKSILDSYRSLLAISQNL